MEVYQTKQNQQMLEVMLILQRDFKRGIIFVVKLPRYYDLRLHKFVVIC